MIEKNKGAGEVNGTPILPTADQWVKNITLLCMRKSKKFEPKAQVG
jgi:hypothetical protein